MRQASQPVKDTVTRLHFSKLRSQGSPLVICRNGCERSTRRNSSLSERHRPSLLTSEHLVLPWVEAQREPAVIGVRLTVTRGFGNRTHILRLRTLRADSVVAAADCS